MNKPKFRKAKEMPKNEKRVPVSARISEPLKALLMKEADRGDLSLGELIEAVLEDYGKWLSGQK